MQRIWNLTDQLTIKRKNSKDQIGYVLKQDNDRSNEVVRIGKRIRKRRTEVFRDRVRERTGVQTKIE